MHHHSSIFPQKLFIGLQVLKMNIRFILLVFIVFMSCSPQKKSDDLDKGNEVPITQNNEPAVKNTGLINANLYCSSCHKFPTPDLLDKSTWENTILPRMGCFLGIYGNINWADLLEKDENGRLIDQEKIYPKTPLITDSVWNSIKDYYLSNAPDKLNVPLKENIQVGLDLFSVKKPNPFPDSVATSLIDASNYDEIMVGETESRALYFYDRQLNQTHHIFFPGVPVWTSKFGNDLLITAMGNFYPSDIPKGFVLILEHGQVKPKMFIRNLNRPVHTAVGDLNGDGLEDLVISEFGKWEGRLTWWERSKRGMQRHVLMDKTGPVKSYVRDLNADGRLDVITLFAQGDEAIYAFYNEGNGNFRPEKLITFDPSMGSTYFDLHDFNGDGAEDIIYTAGDNGDFITLYKPYHGIRIFLNDGTNHFHERFFYPMNGAFKAIPSDFDQDGDLDIAAISFYPDNVNQSEDGFVYLECTGEFQYKAYTLPHVTQGRWIAMDASDVDHDGDEDLLLGSFNLKNSNISYKSINTKGAFILLENTTKF